MNSEIDRLLNSYLDIRFFFLNVQSLAISLNTWGEIRLLPEVLSRGISSSFLISSFSLLLYQGVVPVSISYKMMPTEKMSL